LLPLEPAVRIISGTFNPLLRESRKTLWEWIESHREGVKNKVTKGPGPGNKPLGFARRGASGFWTNNNETIMNCLDFQDVGPIAGDGGAA
jgi:hypothetical protein